jgi:SAM-dependent methyltransferase
MVKEGTVSGKKARQTRAPKQRVTPKLERPILRLDLGGGQHKEEGWKVVDKWEGADVVHDLFTFPWPFKDSSVDAARMLHFFEHVPAKLRFAFMDELWRVLRPDAEVFIVCPYYSSMGAVQDPTHEWPPICDATFIYFNKPWRVATKLDHYPVSCDFDQSGIEYTADAGPPLNIGQRNEEFRSMVLKHYINVAQEIKVRLFKRVGR